MEPCKVVSSSRKKKAFWIIQVFCTIELQKVVKLMKKNKFNCASEISL